MLHILIYIFFSIEGTVCFISCLVMRPGYGLVSEQCPHSSVGCRIRQRENHIEWYEWAKLYDRNQLVCVYPEEYETLTGCVRKQSGSLRCWCGGRMDCNDPKTSRELIETYRQGYKQRMEEIIDKLEKINETKKISKGISTKILISTNITQLQITRKPTQKKHKILEKNVISPTSTMSSSNQLYHFITTPAEYNELLAEAKKKLDMEMHIEDERNRHLLIKEKKKIQDEQFNTENKKEKKTKELEQLQKKEKTFVDEQQIAIKNNIYTKKSGMIRLQPLIISLMWFKTLINIF